MCAKEVSSEVYAKGVGFLLMLLCRRCNTESLTRLLYSMLSAERLSRTLPGGKHESG
jgi:hypothetical protein